MNNLETQIYLDRYKARELQRPLMDAIIKQNKRRALAVWPRRFGKDYTALAVTVHCALKKVGLYLYLLPTATQARKIIWDGIDIDGRPILDIIPPSAIVSKHIQDMKIKLINGSIIQFSGSDNYDRLMGINAQGIVFSEYALQDPRAYQYLRPVLTASDGWALFISTPRGKNHLWSMYNVASQSDDWFCSKLSVVDTHHISINDIQREIALGEMSEDLAQQEYFCFPDSVNVLTSESLISIADVKEEDLVITHTGRPRKVLKTHKREYQGDLIEIGSYGSYEPIICTPNHPIRVYHKSTQKYEWKNAGDITLEDRVTFPKLTLGIYPVISYELCMLLAWYITEGSSFKNGLQFTVGKKEEVDRIASLLSKLNLESKVISKDNAHNVIVNSVQFVDFFKKYCGNTAKNKRIPLWLISSYEEDFFYELIKGDGCISVHKDYTRYVYSTISKTLAYQVQLLAHSIPNGLTAGITHREGKPIKFPHGKIYDTQDSYVVQVHKKNPNKRQFEGFMLRAKNCVAARIKYINTVPFSGDVYNIKVQYDESYTANGRDVHNCSFELGVEGSYYAKYIDQLNLKSQIGYVPWEPAHPVYVALDIGVRDSTSIIWFQVIGQTCRIIDCYEKNKEGLEHYVNIILNKPYTYAKFFAPHDMKQMEFGSGMTRWAKARDLGITFTVVDNIPIVDGIEVVRSTLPRCWFNEETTRPLRKALENYRQEFDNKRKVYKGKPLHDQFSHFADAFRYLAVGLRYAKKGTSAEELERRYHETVYGSPSHGKFFDNTIY